MCQRIVDLKLLWNFQENWPCHSRDILSTNKLGFKDYRAWLLNNKQNEINMANRCEEHTRIQPSHLRVCLCTNTYQVNFASDYGYLSRSHTKLSENVIFNSAHWVYFEVWVKLRSVRKRRRFVRFGCDTRYDIASHTIFSCWMFSISSHTVAFFLFSPANI